MFIGYHTSILSMLHDDKLTFTDIDATVQQQLVVIVGLHWKYLAPYINPSAPPSDGNVELVIDQFQKWRERMHPTIGDLSEILCHLYIQTPLPLSVVQTSLLSRDSDGLF